MPFEIIRMSSALIEKQAIIEIEKCNDFTAQYGLILSHHDVIELIETRNFALKSNGRIEFGGGVINKIIRGFCDSPYLTMDNYAETIHDLTEIFYFYKNETLDLISDDELIKFMKNVFDGRCQGSLELLSGRELENMARNLRYGYSPNYSVDTKRDKEDEDEQY